jgi:hypothetical protein
VTSGGRFALENVSIWRTCRCDVFLLLSPGVDEIRGQHAGGGAVRDHPGALLSGELHDKQGRSRRGVVGARVDALGRRDVLEPGDEVLLQTTSLTRIFPPGEYRGSEL